MTDEYLLQRATELDRIILTQDVRFKALAEEWQRQGKPLTFALRQPVGCDDWQLREGFGIDRQGDRSGRMGECYPALAL
jgi:hypothetical protein